VIAGVGLANIARAAGLTACAQNPRGPNTLMPSFFSIARPKRYFISGPS
jgi:hypothetical protein